MWPVDYVRAPEFVERQSPRTRVLLAFVFFTVSCLVAVRGLFGFPLGRSLFDSVGGGIGLAGAIAWRDRRRARRGVEFTHPD
jgi:hypothetical protein